MKTATGATEKTPMGLEEKPLDPASMALLRQLLRRHGAAVLTAAIRDIERADAFTQGWLAARE